MEADGSVDLWIWSLDRAPHDIARLAVHLDASERARAENFLQERDATRFVAARAKLREVLASYLDCAPREVAFSYGAQGKPFVGGSSGLQFNLAHSEGTAALAVAQGIAVGIDIEVMHPLQENVAGRFFSTEEIVELAALLPQDQMRGFYQGWTRKEAVVKALGGGLSIPLNSFTVRLSPVEEARLVVIPPSMGSIDAWSLLHFEVGSNCIGAIVVAAPGARLNVKTM